MASGRHTALSIHLTAAQRQTLQLWQRSPTLQARRARRGRILLLLADQVPVSQIAKTIGISRHSIYKWAQRFREGGLEGLAEKRGRNPKAGERKSKHG